MLNEKISQRFQKLEDQLKNFDNSRAGNQYLTHVWLSWATSAQDLIKSVFGENSSYYTNYVEYMDKCKKTNGYIPDVITLASIFRSAEEAFEGGYIFDIDRSISGEVLGDFVALAKEALASGKKDVAAVLASAALEDALKRYAKLKGINDVGDAEMKQVISALKSKGLVGGARTSLLNAMPKLRNFALHANWDKVTEPETSSLIGFVENFLLTEFSP